MTRTDQQVEALDRILLLTTILDADMTRGLEKVGLSQSRVRPVMVLHENGPSTQRELADALGFSARNVTGLVDALVETGFVRRGPHPTDRRATLVSLTPRGRRVADGLAEGRDELARQLFETMPQRTFAGFVAGLDSVLATINELLEEERHDKVIWGWALFAWRFEVNLYKSLFRFVTRRPDVPAGSTGVRYVGAVSVLLWAFVIGSAVELVVLHVILPWEKVRLVADIVGIWGLMWMLGFTASHYVYPHLVGADGLRLRSGHHVAVDVPWDAVAGASTRERSVDGSKSLMYARRRAPGPGRQPHERRGAPRPSARGRRPRRDGRGDRGAVLRRRAAAGVAADLPGG